MRKILKHLYLFYRPLPLTILLFTLSCKQDICTEVVEGVSGNEISLLLSATSEDDTKVTFTDSQNVRWESTDHVAVFDGSAKRNFSNLSGSGTSALFSGTVAASYSNLYTVYPYSAAGSLSGSNVTVTVPSEQTVSTGNRVDPSAIVSVGKVNTSNMTVEFKQVCGLVSFEIATSNIYKVIIEGSNIAGTATVAAATGVLSSVSSGSGRVIVGYSGGGNFPTGKYYAAVLPGTTAAGNFAVGFVHEDGITERQSVSSAVTIARKGRKAAGTVTNGNPKVRHIFNKAQLNAWGAAMGNNGGDEQSFTVYLDADIDYGGNEWPYTARDTHFNGNFRGQNHKIYNIIVTSTTNTSFITGLYGRFDDVIFGSSDGTNWDKVSCIKHTGNEGGVEYVGLIGEMRANNVTFMTNVTNFAPVYVPSGYNTRAFIGGLVGHIQSGKTVTMTDCKNYGSVSNSSSWTGDQTRMGGILGQCDGSLLGSGLENHGGLTVNNAKTNFIGGLCGDLDSGSQLTGCKNYGSIVFSDNGTSKTYLGGCFGSVRGSSIYDCHNHAALTAVRNAEHNFGGIVGLLESGTTSITACTNHTGADITVQASVGKRVIMGGIAGYNNNSVTLTIQDCLNEAVITSNGAASDFGGIMGVMCSNSTEHSYLIQNCENTGTVSSTTADNSTSLNRELRVGGILGMADAEDGGAQTVKSCVNKGLVSASGALYSGASVRVGGVVGIAYCGVQIDKCKNFANVTCPVGGSNAGAARFTLGGILGYIPKRAASRYQQITDCINTGNVSSLRNYNILYLGGIIGGGTNEDGYPLVSGCKNYGTISTNQTNQDTMIGGIAGYTCFNLTNNSNFGNATGGTYHGAVYADNNNYSSSSGTKVGAGVVVNGVAAPAKGTYSFNSGNDTTHSNPDKGWFTGWNGNKAITVTVVDQESYTGSTEPEEAGEGGYLFAHTGNGDGKYYRMYYAISHDGLSWTVLNSGASPMPTYYGFPYITKDNSGVYYLIGVTNSEPRNPVVWRSSDCVTWTVVKSIPASVFDLPSAYRNDTNSYGAIKIFHDPVSSQFVLTWHAGESDKSGDDYWESMRTFYVRTSDFETFTTAQKLFSFNTGHIDTSLHYYDGKYYALYKHELTYDSDKNYYKRPRMCSSTSLTGSYSLVTSNNYLTPRHREGPTMVKSPDNSKWYLYVENYHNDAHVYELYYSTSLTVSGPWTQNNSFTPPDNANGCRHGCVIPIDAKTYRHLQAAY